MTMPQDSLDRFATAAERIADALEQLVLAGIPADPYPRTLDPVDEIDDLPPVGAGVPASPPRTAPAAPQAPAATPGGVCPIHNTPWKVVPAGISKKTGNPYSAFTACTTTGCDQRPPR